MERIRFRAVFGGLFLVMSYACLYAVKNQYAEEFADAPSELAVIG